MTYFVSEVGRLHSFSRAERITAKNLTIAKRKASRYKMFLSTVLYLGRTVDSNGFISEPIAVKKGHKWVDLDNI